MEVFEPVPIVKGRVEIMATVMKTEMKTHAEWGDRLHGLFFCEGPVGRFKLWGAVPTKLIEIAESSPKPDATLVGSLVRFYAKIHPSHDDECFGFFNRPTRPEILVIGKNGRERG